MRFYDCDEEGQFEELSRRVEEDEMVRRNLIQVFSPDTPTEARNRCFRPVG